VGLSLTFGAVNTMIRQKIAIVFSRTQSGELARGSMLLLVAKVFGALSGYAMAWLLAQRGSADAVGIYELAFTFIILLSVVARYGLDGALVRYIGQFNATSQPGAVRWLYKRSMFFSGSFSVLLAAALYVSAPLLARIFVGEAMVIPLRWAALALPFFTLMSMNSETMRGFRKMPAYSILQQGTVIFIAALVFLAYSSDTSSAGTSGIRAFFMASLVLFLISAIQTIRLFRKLPEDTVPNLPFRQVLHVASPIFLSSSIFMLMSWTDTLMLGYFMQEGDVGVYRVAFKISTLITFAQFAINGIAAPMIADLYHRGAHKELKQLIHKTGWFNFVLSVPIFLIILFAPSFLLGLFGQEFVQGRGILLILSMGQVVFALSGPVMYILTMTKHERTALHIMYVTAGLNIIGNALLIPVYGLWGAALATSVTTLLWNVLAVIYVFRFIGVIAVPFLYRFIEKDETG
jgi:O-antigen/teichoic acid export membrane protein